MRRAESGDAENENVPCGRDEGKAGCFRHGEGNGREEESEEGMEEEGREEEGREEENCNEDEDGSEEEGIRLRDEESWFDAEIWFDDENCLRDEIWFDDGNCLRDEENWFGKETCFGETCFKEYSL